MDYSKFKLKELIQIVRKNDKVSEALQSIGKKDIRYASKKGLVNYLSGCENIDTDLNKNIEINDNQTVDDSGYFSSGDETNKKDQENQEEIIELDLEKIKNKKVKKSKKIEVPVESEEEIIKKKEAMTKINAYMTRFNFLRYEKIDLSNPIEALEVVENLLSIKKTNPALARQFFNACYGIEYLVTSSPLDDYVKLQGLSRNLEMNQDIKDTVDELLIKYAPSVLGGNICPEYRLGLLMLTVAVTTHINNTSVREKNIDINKPVGVKFNDP